MPSQSVTALFAGDRPAHYEEAKATAEYEALKVTYPNAFRSTEEEDDGEVLNYLVYLDGNTLNLSGRNVHVLGRD